jgi:hypothetical protein
LQPQHWPANLDNRNTQRMWHAPKLPDQLPHIVGLTHGTVSQSAEA